MNIYCKGLKIPEMKILRIFILVLLLIYLLPLGAFCHETKEKNQGHCVLMCHTFCSHAVVTEKKIFASSSSGFPTTMSVLKLSYQSPFLDTSKRPPVVSV